MIKREKLRESLIFSIVARFFKTYNTPFDIDRLASIWHDGMEVNLIVFEYFSLYEKTETKEHIMLDSLWLQTIIDNYDVFKDLCKKKEECLISTTSKTMLNDIIKDSCKRCEFADKRKYMKECKYKKLLFHIPNLG